MMMAELGDYLPNTSEEKPSEILLDISYQRYTNNNEELAKIRLFTRDTNNRSRSIHEIRDFLPYFYIHCTEETLTQLIQSNELLNRWYVSHSREIKRLYYGGEELELLKITGNQPWKVPTIRNLFEINGVDHYEADIPFTQRFMIDHQLKGLQGITFDTTLSQFQSVPVDFEPIICSLDIEVDFGEEDTQSFAELITKADKRITAIGLAFFANEEIVSKEFILQQDNEEEEQTLLQEFSNYLWTTIDPDIIVTYNGDAFDWPYLVKRSKNLGLSSTMLSPDGETEPVAPAFGNGWRIPGVLCYDLYYKTKWLYTQDGKKTLNSVAQELLGVQKIELEYDHGELWKLSLQDDNLKKKFSKYVRRDAVLTRRLYDAMNMQEWIEVIKICGAPPGEAINFTERQSGEFLVYQIMHQRKTLIPSSPTPEERKQRKRTRKSAKGGLVLDPTREIASSVLIADFASMYPSIIVAHNIGGESFTGTEATPKERFRSQPQTTMALMQEEMLSKRSVVKDELADFEGPKEEYERLQSYSRALKLVSNSTFGSYNYIGSRFYDYDIASTITQIGRDYLRELTVKSKEFGEGYEAIYGDTDSVFIEMPNLKDKVEQLWNAEVEDKDEYKHYIPEINDLIDFVTAELPEQLQLEFHDFAYRIIFHKGAKKRYAYVSAIDKSIYIYGFEAIRHDWSTLAKKVQKRAFDLILKTGDLLETKTVIIDYIQDQLKEENIKDLLVTFGPLKKDPDDYSVQTPAIGAYLHHMHMTGGDASEEWQNIEYFPYIITKGDGPQKDRAKHPDYVQIQDIDKVHYIEEALRTVNRFNLNITVDEVLGIEYLDLIDYFQEKNMVRDPP